MLMLPSARSAISPCIQGPTVTLIVANSLTHGMRAGLLNVAGTQIGLGLMMATLVIGLASVIETMGWWFDWLRLAGAAYLVWLGWKLIRSSGEVGDTSCGHLHRRGRTPRADALPSPA
jgi:homoserine/homoserine lactone efflux protein